MKRIIGVNSNCYHGYPIEDALLGIHQAGFHYVELTATKGWTEHVGSDQTFKYLENLKKRMKDLDLIPFAMSGHCNLMDGQRLTDFIMNIKLAAYFGCDYIVSSIGEAHLPDGKRGSREILTDHLKILVPYLQEFGMKLVLECHGEHSTGGILKEIVDLVDAPQVQINYDTANVIFYGHVDPAQDIDTCMGQVAYIHLKDKDGEQKEWNFPAVGRGKIDFPTIFHKLETSGNYCPFSIEIEFTPDGPGSLETVNQAVLDSANYLKDQGFVL